MCRVKMFFKSNSRRIMPSFSVKESCLFRESLHLLGNGVQKARLGSNAGGDPHLVLLASRYLCVFLGEA